MSVERRAFGRKQSSENLCATLWAGSDRFQPVRLTYNYRALKNRAKLKELEGQRQVGIITLVLSIPTLIVGVFLWRKPREATP